MKVYFSHFSQTVLPTLDKSLMFYHFGTLLLDNVYPHIHDISCSNSISVQELLAISKGYHFQENELSFFSLTFNMQARFSYKASFTIFDKIGDPRLLRHT